MFQLAFGCAVDPSGLGTPDGSVPNTDLCPDDDDKLAPGRCGCGVPDDDSDGDGDPDCIDECPEDGDKTMPGECGCGVPDDDGDGDSSPTCLDCDDTDPARHPGASETCDGVDQDCDARVDEGACAGGEPGCADDSREGFADTGAYPAIAACQGAWSETGLQGLTTPTCSHSAGNDGSNAVGTGCSASDLCAVGWHVCATLAEIEAATPAGCGDATTPDADPTFYLTGVSGTDGSTCSSSGEDGAFGCGTGGVPLTSECGVLDRRLDRPCALYDGDLAWNCDGHRGSELRFIRKLALPHGGVLCCRD